MAWEKAEDYKTRYPQLYDEAFGRYIAVCLDVIHKSKGVAECVARRKELIRQMRGTLPSGAVNTLNKKEKIKLLALRIGVLPFDVLMGVYMLTHKRT